MYNKLNYVKMGVKLLNTLLQRLNTDGILRTNLKILKGKKIVVDANIYMYRYEALGNIIENFYLMCSIMIHYNIHLLFIFDGNTRTDDKAEMLQNRKDTRKQYINTLQDLLVTFNDDKNNIRLKKQIERLKLKCSYYTKSDLEEVKKLLDSCGIMHRTAEGEADELCAALVLENKAYACLTEDTDLFVYGCPRILKYFSSANHDVMFYDLDKILNVLGASLTEFQELCCFSGTDYNINDHSNLFENLEHFEEYKCSNNKKGFINWLSESNEKAERLYKVKNKYNIDNKKILSQLDYFIIKNKYLNHYKIKNLLINHGFIFIN